MNLFLMSEWPQYSHPAPQQWHAMISGWCDTCGNADAATVLNLFAQCSAWVARHCAARVARYCHQPHNNDSRK